MDKSERTLVPQWLKGASGCGGGSTSQHSLTSIHPDDCGVPFSAARHRNLLQSHSFSGTSQSEYDSPRNSALIDRGPLSSSRRGLGTNGSINDRDRAYVSFNRNSSFRGDRERDLQRFEKDREWERDLAFRDCHRDKDQDRYDFNLRSNSSFGSKYETDATVKRRTENESKKSGNELGSMTSSLGGGNLVGNINKAAFERNFPSLGSEDRQSGNQSSLTSSSFSNFIWHGQGIAVVSDIGRASSPGLIITTGSSQAPSISGSVFGADGWSSALANAPVLNGGSSVPIATSQQTTPGTSISSVTSGIASSSGLNMAEALVQHLPRVRTPPQLSIETQRLEELALKQSRQLIPMTPTMPKTTGFGPSEKLKPKMLRSIDSPPSTGKVGQQLNSPLRVPTRPEPTKMPQGGKLIVLKSSREKNGVSKSIKSGTLSPTKAGNINMSVGALTAGVGMGGNCSLTGPRKPIVLDRKTMLMPSISGSTAIDSGTPQRLKDNSLMNDEKKPLSQAQNRNDFFNALRRKSSGNFTVTGIQEQSNTSGEEKAIGPNSNGVPNSESRIEVKDCSLESVNGHSSNAVLTVEAVCNLDHNLNASSGVVRGEIDTTAESSETGSPASSNMYSVMWGSEEEEAALLRSLGWEEDAGEEEALTEEEINAFYQQMKSRPVSSTFRGGGSKFPNVAVEMHVGSLGSISSEPSSSDSEPDDS